MDPGEVALRALVHAIVRRDRPATLRLLANSPQLAQQAMTLGATRDNPRTDFFEEIAHYAYAGDTPLHMAAAAYQREIAADLVSRGADVSAKNRRGAEPLHYACDGQPGSGTWDPAAQSAIVEFLIGVGADPNSHDKNGVAPLHRAVRTRCSAAVRALLEHGAHVRQRNTSGSTPLHLAIQNTGRGGSGSAASRAEQKDIIRLLLGAGARASDKDATGKTVADCVTTEWILALLKV